MDRTCGFDFQLAVQRDRILPFQGKGAFHAAARGTYKSRENPVVLGEINSRSKSLIHKAEINHRIEPKLRVDLIAFLRNHQEFLDQCEVDASAFARDVYENGAKFSESKCREYLRMLDPNLEVFERIKGVPERKYIELLESAEYAGRMSST